MSGARGASGAIAGASAVSGPVPLPAGAPAAETRDSRTTVVFLHGTRLTGAEWSAQIAELSDEFHVLAPDLAGHGSAATIAFTLAGAADRVAELVEQEAIDGRALVVGLSLGGYVAMELAARHPHRVTGLVLAGATAEPVGARSAFYRFLAIVLERVPARPLGAVNTRWFRWRYPAAIADPIVAGGYFFEGGAVALRALVGERFRPRLAAYPGPTLLLNGELDLFFRPAERSFAAAATRPRRVVVRRATHLSNIDQPGAFSAAVRAFAHRIVADGADAPGAVGGVAEAVKTVEAIADAVEASDVKACLGRDRDREAGNRAARDESDDRAELTGAAASRTTSDCRTGSRPGEGPMVSSGDRPNPS